MKLSQIAQAVGLACISMQAFAQTAPATPPQLEKVEITGSSIKRVQDEGALPVQVITREQLDRSGITTAEQLLGTISANGNGLDNLATNQGGDFLSSLGSPKNSHNNGASGASLRGLGTGYTLVLLNGRRVSTHGLNGSSVDLNSIPLAAVERVEILKDGASAIYGTDAIGGVINFILRKDFRGGEVSVLADKTQHGKGDIYRGSVILGIGDLSKDRFNLMASLSFDTNNRLRGADRDFHDGYQPERGLAPDTTGAPFANIGQVAGTALARRFSLPGSTQTYNRVNLLALQGKCDSIPNMGVYRGDITGFNNNNQACAWDYGKAWSLMQPVDRTNIVSKGTFALNNEHTLVAEIVASKVKSAVEYTPVQFTGLNYPAFIRDANGNNVRAPYYQDLTGLVPGFNNQLAERIRWRCLECGPRQQVTTTDASRFLVGAEGVLAGWEYKVGYSAGQSAANTLLGDGYLNLDKINAAIRGGLINPFLKPGETQTQAALDLINAAKVTGTALYGGKSTVRQFDGNFSSEIAKLPAGPLSAAVGFEFRKEGYRFNDDTADNPIPIVGVSAPSSLDTASRTIKAVYAELAIPIIKDLDAQLAIRHDRYSDFGSTTNPKVSLRFQPTKNLGFRGSYSTGFRAPDFESLYGGSSTGQFNSDINDPVLCPTGKEPLGCGIRPSITGVSNPFLTAEKSKQWSIGVFAQPLPWLSASVDVWNIQLNDRIGAISGQFLINNYATFRALTTRDSDGVLDGVVSPTLNIASDKTRGVDINVTGNFKTSVGSFVATMDATYTDSFKTQFSSADPFSERVGQFGDLTYGFDLHVRLKMSNSLTWSQGPWSATLSHNYTSGYTQEKDGYGSGFTPAAAPDSVKAYNLFNVTATYKGIKNLTLMGGIKNLFDTKPSFSSHNVDNVAGAGWDARVGDPRLRSFVLRATYKF